MWKLQAVEALKGWNHDLTLIDVQMPVMDGFEGAAAIRRIEREQRRKRLPLIALTALAMKGDRERSLTAGMDDYVSKPVRKDDLNKAHHQSDGRQVGLKECGKVQPGKRRRGSRCRWRHGPSRR